MLIVGLAYIVFCWFFRLTGQSWAVRFMGLPQSQNGCHGILITPGSWWWFLGKWGHSFHTMLLLNSAMTTWYRSKMSCVWPWGLTWISVSGGAERHQSFPLPVHSVPHHASSLAWSHPQMPPSLCHLALGLWYCLQMCLTALFATALINTNKTWVILRLS